LRASAVDNRFVSQVKANPIPLPVAVLALSVAVCVGSAGAIEAQALRAGSSAQAQQRASLEQLLEAIQQAAKDLDDRLDTPTHADLRVSIRPAVALRHPIKTHLADACLKAGPPLREALLNLPPPSA